jgi:hypothetical protein
MRQHDLVERLQIASLCQAQQFSLVHEDPS